MCNIHNNSEKNEKEIFLDESNFMDENNIVNIMLNSIDGFAVLLRPKTREIIASNKIAQEMGGLPGLTCYGTMGKSDSPCYWCKAPILWKEKKTQQKEIGAVGVYWDAYWVFINENLYFHYGFDISEKKRIADSISYQTSLLDNVSDAIISTDLDFKLVSWNKAAENLYGWDVKEVIGEDIAGILQNDYKYHTREEVLKEFLELGYWKGELSQKNRKGEMLHIFASVSLIRDAKGIGTGVVAINRDISDIKRKEEELIKTQKIESIGVLAGGIAHDFNNILTAIIGNLSLASMEVKDEKILELLKESANASMRAKQLTNQLLTFSKGGNPVKKLISLQKITEETIRFALRGSKTKFLSNYSEDLWNVKADQGQIGQVINNLAINAHQAMPEGGNIHIEIKNASSSDFNEYPLTSMQKYIHLIFCDEGVGISAENISKIFDPYFSTKPTGNGLGLTVCYSIIKNHGGFIFVNSSPGEGSTFHIFLPASTNSKENSNEEVQIPVKPGKGKIIIMDDEKPIRDLGIKVLTKLGYEVYTAINTTDLIEKFLKAKEESPFDLVILDLTIPGEIGGKEAIKRVREIDPHILAIVSSGYSTDPIMSQYQKFGFNGVLVKPFIIADLSELLSTLLCKPQNNLNPLSITASKQ